MLQELALKICELITYFDEIIAWVIFNANHFWATFWRVSFSKSKILIKLHTLMLRNYSISFDIYQKYENMILNVIIIILNVELSAMYQLINEQYFVEPKKIFVLLIHCIDIFNLVKYFWTKMFSFRNNRNLNKIWRWVPDFFVDLKTMQIARFQFGAVL